MNITRTPRAVKSTSTNPSWCQLLLVYYISTTTDGFHYTSPSAKPSTTGNVQIVCASSQWVHIWPHFQKESSLEITCGWDIGGTLPWRYRESAHQPLGTACKELLVLRGGPAMHFFLGYHRHLNFQILPQQCLLSEIILEVCLRWCVKWTKLHPTPSFEWQQWHTMWL